MKKRLSKDLNDKKIAGVCSGIARYFDIDPTIIRVIWLIAVLCFGFGLLAYIICWIVLPDGAYEPYENSVPNVKVEVVEEEENKENK